MNATTPKFVHLATGSLAGRMTAVAACGRLVGRMSLSSSSDTTTCHKCLAADARAKLVTFPHTRADGSTVRVTIPEDR